MKHLKLLLLFILVSAYAFGQGTPPSTIKQLTTSQQYTNPADSAVWWRISATGVPAFYYQGVRMKELKDSLNKKQTNLKVVSIIDFGAVTGGIIDATSSIQAAINTGKAVYVPPGTYLVTTLNIPMNAFIYGAGRSSVLKTASNAPIISIINGQDVIGNSQIHNVSFQGDGKGAAYDEGKTLQDAIYIESSFQNIISGCYFESLGGTGVHLKDATGYHVGNTISDCHAYDCNAGYRQSTAGEYGTFSNCSAVFCNYGLRVAGGNASFTGGSLTDSKTGVKLEGGGNNGHGFISNVKINHNTSYSIHADGCTQGMTFNSCGIYYGDIYLKNSNYIKILNGDLNTPNFFSENSFFNVVKGNFIDNDIVHEPNYNATSSSVFWSENIYKTSSNFGYKLQNVKGALITRYIVSAGDTLSVNAVDSLVIDFNTSYRQWISNNQNYSSEIYEASTKSFLNKNLNGGHALINGALKLLVSEFDYSMYLKVEVLNFSNVVDRYFMISGDRILSTDGNILSFKLNMPLNLGDSEKIRFKIINGSPYTANLLTNIEDSLIEIEGL